MENRKPGEIIDIAYEIMDKTYSEIYDLKSEFEKLLLEKDRQFEYLTEYSFGPKRLYLKEYHIFIYIKRPDDVENTREYMGMCILFSNHAEYPKKTSIKGPELWTFRLMITSAEEPPFNKILQCFSPGEIKYFSNRNPFPDGAINKYYFKSENEDSEWQGAVIGFPLTDVINKEFILNRILKPLLEYKIDE